ncbi:hypothetical protein [Demequina zhanjiangensis]|uniref:Uncharacterized protein n=1 Tax=Demequina zhanjiangensis TaxID=3051659 RepID=A0ABT8G368_9MICO|nr:hypothetical protein [Demequina sp. SYSU T00b26]MDN4473538.1 hypothetical protein [Demequina sp. SYSU T00b26]
MISFSDMEGALIPAIVLSVIIILAAALSEGRGLYLLTILLGGRDRAELRQTMLGDDVPREVSDWNLVGRLDSPTREEDGEHVPGLRDVVALKDRLPEVREHLPELKGHLPQVSFTELPGIRGLREPAEIEPVGEPASR